MIALFVDLIKVTAEYSSERGQILNGLEELTV